MKMPVFMPWGEIPSQIHALFSTSPGKETVYGLNKKGRFPL
jgi:hypothetical protein|tara:strand:+ start:40 stop:162 length:123 start_codon:yes stop_codon:yes gene_type:complete